LYAGPAAFRTAREGRTALAAAGKAFVRRDALTARTEFVRADGVFRTAERRLGSPLLWPLRLVPVVNTHIAVGHSLSVVGARMAEAGYAATQALQQLPDRELKLRNGRVDLTAVRRARAAFGGTIVAATDLDREVKQMSGGWVVGPLARARREAVSMLPPVVDGLRKGQTALDVIPSFFAGGGVKRYVIAFSNLSELRGSGGFIGFVTLLRATNGKLELEDVSGRPTELFPPPGESSFKVPDWFTGDLFKQSRIFQNVNLTSDFPTSASLIVQTAKPALGQVDGVIGVDPVGLSAILQVTGPISIPSWPAAITADNVSRIAQHDVYLRIAKEPDRDTFFKDLVRATFDRLVTVDIAMKPQSVGSFDAVVQGGHLRLYSVDPEDEAAFSALGLAGGVDRAAGANDVLSVLSINSSGNKIDWYLHRSIRYRVRLEPDADSATADLQIDLKNDAPTSGLPDYVIGSKVRGLPRGTNRQTVRILASGGATVRAVTVDGRVLDPAVAREGDLRSYSVGADIPPSSSVQIQLTSTVQHAVTLVPGGRVYRLRILPQPVAEPDFADIAIQPPAGWLIEGKTSYTGALKGDLVLEVRLHQTRRAWLFQRVVVDPWRLAGDIVGRIL
jgi:hypothetical protein